MISSTDLIDEQIRVAMGEKLRYKQVIVENFLDKLSMKGNQVVTMHGLSTGRYCA